MGAQSKKSAVCKTGSRFSPDTESVGNLILDLACRTVRNKDQLFKPPVYDSLGFPGSVSGKELACQLRRHEMGMPSQGWEDPLVATHCSILAWRIPWTEEPGWLQSIGSQKVRHIWSSLACKSTMIVYYNSLSKLRHKWGQGIWNLRTKAKWFENLNFMNIYIHST